MIELMGQVETQVLELGYNNEGHVFTHCWDDGFFFVLLFEQDA